MLTGDEKFVRSGRLRLWTERHAVLSAVTAPTLVVHGSEDVLFPPAHGEALAGQIPGARLEVLPGMGHHPFFAPGLTPKIADLIIRHTTGRQTA
jgi:pimeloyl-ACP methyl ester carboxylesterase